jgi:hypothetical protein
MSSVELGWNDEVQTLVVKVTENWIVSVTPMIFNDRVCLASHRDWPWGYTAGWCYDKGAAAGLAAQAWDPEKEWEPVGWKKLACDGRVRSSD